MAATPSVTPSAGHPTTPVAPANGPRIFAYYYLWWSAKHWRDALGGSYPYASHPLPLPATLDGDGCKPTATFGGATVTDVPAQLDSQDDPGVIERDVRDAISAGLAGFAVNWIGTGSPSQPLTGNSYTLRMQALVDAVHKVNAEGHPFSLWLSYKASVNQLSTDQINGDLTWFAHTYAHDSAFDHAKTPKLTVIWNGSRKYPIGVLAAVSAAQRDQLRLIGDETTWSAERAPYLDGDAYYWSSQNPYTNPRSFAQLSSLAQSVRATGKNTDGSAKVFVAPLAAGYDKMLIGGTSCTPRRGGATLRTMFAGNRAATHPDDWALISWNEITEGTYVTPMQRFGRRELDVLKALTSSK